MTVNDLVTDVLRNLGIISEIATPSAEQGQDAVTKLNDLVFDLAEDGIDIGFNPKATTAEAIALPDGDKAGLKAMLGVRLCDTYGASVPSVMAAMADAWYKRKLRQALHATMRQTVSDAPSGEARNSYYDIYTGR